MGNFLNKLITRANVYSPVDFCRTFNSVALGLNSQAHKLRSLSLNFEKNNVENKQKRP